jgi:hypothetical protein
MTDERDDVDGRHSGAPADSDLLDRIQQRLSGDTRFRRVESEPAVVSDRLVCVYDAGFYPATVQSAQLELFWFENGDFSVHYHEDHQSGAFDHRWDRHPSDHNARDHVHPGPDAPTPGEDATHPDDWRDVLAMILGEIDQRQRSFW